MEGEKSDSEKLGLQGNVMTLKQAEFTAIVRNGLIVKDGKKQYSDVHQFTYSETGQIVEDIEYGDSDKVIKITKSTYDTNRKLLEQATFYKGELFMRWEYGYNEKGYLVKHGNTYAALFPVNHETYYEYNDEGKLSKKQCFTPGKLEVFEYRYEVGGELAEEAMYDANMDLQYREFYAKEDNVSACMRFDSQNVRMERHENVHDLHGNVIKHTFNNYIGDWVSTSYYKFDDRNNEIEEFIDDIDLKKTIKKEYKYDAVGNWIECTTFEDGVPERIVERQITYY